MNDQTYWAWGLYGVAATLQWLFWRDMAAPAFAMARLDGGVHYALLLRWPMFGMAISCLAWPIFAMVRLDYDGDAWPRLVFLFGSILFAWIGSRVMISLFGTAVGPPADSESTAEGEAFARMFLALAGWVVVIGLLIGAAAWWCVYYDFDGAYRY